MTRVSLAPQAGTEPACNDSDVASGFRHAASDELLALPRPDNAVAVIGMACKYAGADSPEQLWDILEAGKSQSRDLPSDRFPEWRFSRSHLKSFKANTIDDVDAFDHKFFKVTSREATFMDPQQRLALQVAYQALESAGYFSRSVKQKELDMGCYVAVSANDYLENAASHPPSAFSLTGSIRSFTAGRVSHHFGWTGPSITYDTACSASGTAIHQACRAVVTGECQSAVAGAANIFVSPHVFQDLGAAGFISMTGASKCFDSAADGYCRGEGVAFVVLKKLSAALQDGDPIHGVIASTAIGQNANETAITVPHSASQMSLYRKALRLAGLNARDISYVEAHGTGTRVGDPIEAASIRAVFGNSACYHASEKTYIGSIKSSIGHTEATSGISSLIKVIMMMQKKTIPQQALFNDLNPAIAPLEPDGIEISKTNIPWTRKFKAACVNNYGASGSNAVMVVTQAPDVRAPSAKMPVTMCPISVTASSPSSLTSYCSNLLDYVSKFTECDSINDVSYHLSRRRNPDLPYSVCATVSSLHELENVLGSAMPQQPRVKEHSDRPVIMFFGGQTGRVVDVPRALYDSCAVFQKHLDNCDSVLRTFGVPSIFPAIFEHIKQENIVLLHSMLFSGQYASAMAWLDCGLRPTRLIGHSFGQLTALCVSGVLSLRDGLRLVVERARLVEKAWGSDPGSMIAIEADLDTVTNLLASRANHNLEIACRNGARNFVVAGSTASANALETTLRTAPRSFQWKRLQVTNAFHSCLADSLVKPLQDVAERMTFRDAKIPVELCSDNGDRRSITPALVASHVKEPVYFYQAVERISAQLGSCTWVEAGMGAGARVLRRALGESASSHNIKSADFNSGSSMECLAKLTSDLWDSGVEVQFWPFHQSQRHQYKALNLPPYVFDKSRHWLDWKESPHATETQRPATLQTPLLQPAPVIRGDGKLNINDEYENWQKICSSLQMSIDGLQRTLLHTAGAIQSRFDAFDSSVSISSEGFSTPRTDSVASTISTNHVQRQSAANTKTYGHSPSDIVDKTRGILCNLSGVEPEEIQHNSDLMELGIDSLMAMEVVREVDIAFKCKLSNEQLMQLTDFNSMVTCIRAALGSEDEEGESYATGDEMKENKNQASLADTSVDIEEHFGHVAIEHAFDQSPEVFWDNNNAVTADVDCTDAVRSNSVVGGSDIQNGLQRESAQPTDNLVFARKCPGPKYFMDTDHFDVVNSSHGLADSGVDVKFNLQTTTEGQRITAESTISNVFGELKHMTDEFIKKDRLDGYCRTTMPRLTELCIAYIVDAFEQLGCSIRSATPGQRLQRASHLPKHERLVDRFYYLLEHEANLVVVNGQNIRRTTVPLRKTSVDALLAEFVHDEQTHIAEYKLVVLLGPRLAQCLTGQAEGVQILFSEGRDVLAGWYADSPFSTPWISQLETLLEQVVGQRPPTGDPLCILEVGAGTGGTTSKLISMLARLGRPIHYTVTDISGSLVAAARRRFGQYPFVDFKVVDIESEPDAKLLASQHIVVSTNCVHATRDLSNSLRNIHRILRPDGCLFLLEIAQQLPWLDFVFGLVKGWWLFEDDRTHALMSPAKWKKALQAAGYSRIDWTEGDLPESHIQCLIMAHTTRQEPGREQEVVAAPTLGLPVPLESRDRQAVIDSYVKKYTEGWAVRRERGGFSTNIPPASRCVLVTGATGSLGSHIVAELAQRPEIRMVICLNRLSHQEADLRQHKSLKTRGIDLTPAVKAKLKVIATDTSKPQLGLSQETYNFLTHTVTNIVHSAWPMSLTRPLRGYESQFKVMRNLLDLAQEAADHRPSPFRFGFQFVSSIAVVANYPKWAGRVRVPEQLTVIDTVPNGGYPEAKVTCEYMLNQTLYRHPDRFHAVTVRIAQISGSTISGNWNQTEYIPILAKSAQFLQALPELEGTLSWCPVDRVAASLSELMMSQAANDFVYHIDNPSRQPWKHVIALFARLLNISFSNIIPHSEWTRRVRQFEGLTQCNPAIQLIDFFDTHFVPMSCGGLILDVEKTTKFSNTLRSMGPVSDELLERYVEAWRESGYLQQLPS